MNSFGLVRQENLRLLIKVMVPVSYNITLLENMERFATEEEARILMKVVGSALAPVDVTPSLFDQLFSKRPFAMHDTFEITRLATPLLS